MLAYHNDAVSPFEMSKLLPGKSERQLLANRYRHGTVSYCPYRERLLVPVYERTGVKILMILYSLHSMVSKRKELCGPPIRCIEIEM